MKNLNKYLLIACSIFFVFSCQVEDGANLNGASTSSVATDISRGELINATAGVFADMRTGLTLQVDTQSVFGREYWRFQSSEPRYTADLLTANLDNNTFYTVTPYTARYSNIKNINLILEGLDNTTADFSDSELTASRGFLNTIKAHELLMVLNQQYLNGIRIDVEDENDLGGFVGYDQALEAISTLLGTSYDNLVSSGEDFPFQIILGDYSGSVAEFNAALNARVEAYRGNYANVLSLLDQSFLNINGDLRNGAYHIFSLTGADITNSLSVGVNATTGGARVAHPSFVQDILPNDSRMSKVAMRDEPITLDNLTGSFGMNVYPNNTDPVAIVRNEELILLYAEANYQNNSGEAIRAIDRIRTAANLPPYTGSPAPAALLDEILFQKRYSLFGEGGHRWIDLRRFDRLDQLPLDRSGDQVAVQFPRPANENTPQ